jgi:hypothetical protein
MEVGAKVGLGPPIIGIVLQGENKSGEEQESPGVFELALSQLTTWLYASPGVIPEQVPVVFSKLGFRTKFCPQSVVCKKNRAIKKPKRFRVVFIVCLLFSKNKSYSINSKIFFSTKKAVFLQTA